MDGRMYLKAAEKVYKAFKSKGNLSYNDLALMLKVSTGKAALHVYSMTSLTPEVYYALEDILRIGLTDSERRVLETPLRGHYRVTSINDLTIKSLRYLFNRFSSMVSSEIAKKHKGVLSLCDFGFEIERIAAPEGHYVGIVINGKVAKHEVKNSLDPFNGNLMSVFDMYAWPMRELIVEEIGDSALSTAGASINIKINSDSSVKLTISALALPYRWIG